MGLIEVRCQLWMFIYIHYIHIICTVFACSHNSASKVYKRTQDLNGCRDFATVLLII